jgi:hypothetical protein
MNVHLKFPSTQLADFFITSIMVISFSIGTITHLIDVVHFGFFGYSKIPGVSLFENFFWTILLFIDPLIIYLLIFHRRSGAISGLIVLASDVWINYLHITAIPDTTNFNVPSLSLQTACLVFSAATLPKLLTSDIKNRRFESTILWIYSKLPLFVLALGLAIHIKGLILINTAPLSLWALWVHCFMICFNTSLFYLVLKEMRLGFWIGCTTFSIWALIQSGYAIGSFISPRIPFTMEMGIYLAVCCLMISSFIMVKDRMVNKTVMFRRV